VLDANADKVFRFGEDPGAGNVVKLCGKSVLGNRRPDLVPNIIRFARPTGIGRTHHAPPVPPVLPTAALVRLVLHMHAIGRVGWGASR
jgi:hypothetical protein